MFILGNFLRAVAAVLDIVLEVYKWVLILRAIISWVNADPYNPVVQFLYKATEPLLYQIRKYIPTYQFGLDLSVFFAILAIMFMQIFLVRSLSQMAFRFLS